MTCPYSHSDGAYVLGALSPAERTSYEAHLAGCEQCAAAVARLAPVPGLLGRVDPEALNRGAPGPARLPQLLRSVTAQRRRQTRVRRWRLAVVAAAAALLGVAATTAGTGLAGGWSASGPDAPMVPMEPVVSVVPVAAEVATEPVTGGTEVRMTCWYLPVAYNAPAGTFRLVAIGPDGEREQLGSWWAAPGDEVALTGLTRFAGDQLVRLELHSSSGTALLARSFS
ncbi:MAG: anti-sigma factor [Micromonosporaceae bacterium]|nr:anti-sigma factor [Micromonosporaceae bacterium]